MCRWGQHMRRAEWLYGWTDGRMEWYVRIRGRRPPLNAVLFPVAYLCKCMCGRSVIDRANAYKHIQNPRAHSNRVKVDSSGSAALWTQKWICSCQESIFKWNVLKNLNYFLVWFYFVSCPRLIEMSYRWILLEILGDGKIDKTPHKFNEFWFILVISYVFRLLQRLFGWYKNELEQALSEQDFGRIVCEGTPMNPSMPALSHMGSSIIALCGKFFYKFAWIFTAHHILRWNTNTCLLWKLSEIMTSCFHFQPRFDNVYQSIIQCL